MSDADSESSKYLLRIALDLISKGAALQGSCILDLLIDQFPDSPAADAAREQRNNHHLSLGLVPLFDGSFR